MTQEKTWVGPHFSQKMRPLTPEVLLDKGLIPAIASNKNNSVLTVQD
jgi:hypothetical protein